MSLVSDLLSSPLSEMSWAKYQERLKSQLPAAKSGAAVKVIKPKDRNQYFVNYPLLPLEPSNALPVNDFMQVLAARKTNYEMQAAPVDWQVISDLLSFSYGMRAEQELQRRTVASAGAFYPIDIYLHCSPASAAVQQHEASLFYYDVARKALRKLNLSKQGEGKLVEAFEQQELYLQSQVQLFLVMNIDDSLQKYGEKSYQLALLEAGHIAQNFNLVATALGLSLVNVCGFDTEAINQQLMLDGLTSAVVYSLLVG